MADSKKKWCLRGESGKWRVTYDGIWLADFCDWYIQDLQLRLMEKGAEIEALRGEIKRLKAANADQQTVLQNKDGQLDRLGESFSHAPLGRHVVAWLRSRW